MVHPAPQHERDRVVVGAEIVLNDPDVPEVRVRPAGVDRPWTGPRGIREIAAVQVRRPRAQVLDVQNRRREEFLLDIEAPLVLPRIRQAPVGRDDVRRSAGSDDAERLLERERRAARVVLNVNWAASGGLLVRNVNEFIWLGL
jgi:hypothetical protein